MTGPGGPAPQRPAPPPGLDPLTGQDPVHLGGHRLLGRISDTGNGVVYGAVDVNRRCAALRTLPTRDRVTLDRRVEALCLSAAVCAAPVHTVDLSGPVPWIAMEYVPGRDLDTHVRSFGPLEGAHLTGAAAGTAEALGALHTAGTVHGDLAPDRVLLSPRGPRVVGAGLADETLAAAGAAGWSAPETAHGGAPGPGADVFSWACAVVLAATGRGPFGRGTVQEIHERALHGRFDLRGVPEWMAPLVAKSLHPDPRARPGAHALARALLPRGATSALPEALGALLAEHWRGFDAAGHDPVLWSMAPERATRRRPGRGIRWGRTGS
ncbi:protein kinase [Nocardiopsis sp. HNM0947]|uniref:Protein kinase n=1 Tax=Nocardiopsis coralli TaxID=2772213 RepID=A0ABR9P9I2_9ACTN|nr:protein kinase [Nocardiopsis coralli]MBE3000487.1 protein kinase [Nocardiopsis coralli]